MLQAPLNQLKKKQSLELSTYLTERKQTDWLLTLHIQLRFRNVLRHTNMCSCGLSQFIQNHYDTRSHPRLTSTAKTNLPSSPPRVRRQTWWDFLLTQTMARKPTCLLKSSTKIKLFSPSCYRSSRSSLLSPSNVPISYRSTCHKTIEF